MGGFFVSPMLASNWNGTPGEADSTELGKIALLTKQGGWAFDIKWDGVRAMPYVHDGAVTIANRNGVDITSRYPDVVANLQRDLGGRSAILDGEIIALDDDGRPSFNRIAQRDRRDQPNGVEKKIPAIFVAFDVILLDGDSLSNVSYGARVEVLRDLASEWGDGLWLSPSDYDGEAMWQAVTEQRLEGLIAKRVASRYRHSRSADWLKIKSVRRLSCVVTGSHPGKGSRLNKVGALTLGLYKPDGTVIDVGKVGTGLKNVDVDMFTKMRAKDQLVGTIVEVECANITPDGRLRFPSYKGLRSDLALSECSTDQLQPHKEGT